MRLLIKYPTRERPEQFEETLGKYVDLLERPQDTLIHVVVDIDDQPMHLHAATLLEVAKVETELDLHPKRGKIAAINYATLTRPWDILLLASDDMIPQLEGYDEIIRAAFQTHYPDTDGALWIHDGRQDSICTIVCMGRKYYERFGYIYHPAYTSLWCDNEQTEVAVNLGKMLKLPSIIRNESPDWFGSHKRDALYRRNNAWFKRDRMTYRKRRKAGFPI